MSFLRFLNATRTYKCPELVLSNDSDGECENLEAISGHTPESPTISSISPENDTDDGTIDEGQLDARVELAKVIRAFTYLFLNLSFIKQNHRFTI